MNTGSNADKGRKGHRDGGNDGTTAKEATAKEATAKEATAKEASGKGASGNRVGRRPALSSRRKWLFRLIAVSLPLVLLLLFELGLRIGGYGAPMSFALRRSVDGETMIVDNPQFTQLFFEPDQVRESQPFALTQTKAIETCRIFVLGGSAARGTPEPAFGLARALEVMLSHQYPGVRFEVVNTALTAINSHVVLPIAEECCGLDADIIVVYLGNNEAVGPYGAGSTSVPLAGNRSLVRAAVGFRSTRLGQLLRNFIRACSSGEKLPQTSGKMTLFLNKHVRQSDATLQTTYGNFEANLRDICQAGQRTKVPIVLSTVAVNLKDWAPFGSLHRTDLTEDELSKWDAAYKRGQSFEQQGRPDEAVAAYQEALAIDDQHAKLVFLLAGCHWNLKKFDDARAFFQQARDLDTGRFRADSRINAVIRRVAAERAKAGVILADAEDAMREQSAHEVPGNEFFYEHVHFRFPGTYLVTRVLCDAVEQVLPAWVRKHAMDRTPLTEQECDSRMAYTPVDRYDELQSMIDMVSNLPRINQNDRAQAVAALAAESESLRVHLRGTKLQDALATYRRAMNRANVPADLQARYAYVLLNYTDHAKVAEYQLRELLRDNPMNPHYSSSLAMSLLKQGQIVEAESRFRETIRIAPRMSRPPATLAHLLIHHDRFEEAEAVCRQALEINAGNRRARHMLGLALLKQGNANAAVKQLDEVLQTGAALPGVRMHFGMALAEVGRLADAIAELRLELEGGQENTVVLHELATLLVRQRDFQEAAAVYQRILRIDPANTRAQRQLKMLSGR